MCLIIDKMSDYDRANKGFSINGIKYHRLLGTNGGVKNSTIVYVSERLYPQIYERLCCGRNMEQKFVPAKLEAYQALICSGSIPVSMPKGVIVVPDCITHFKEDIIRVDDSQSDEPIVEFLKDQEIELTESDGYGIMLPSLSYDRTNNSADNLEWCSHKENIDYTLAAGRHISQTADYSGKKNPNYGNTTLSQKYKADKTV